MLVYRFSLVSGCFSYLGYSLIVCWFYVGYALRLDRLLCCIGWLGCVLGLIGLGEEFSRIKCGLVWDCCEVVYENFRCVWNIDKDVIRSCHEFFWRCMDVFVRYFIDLELDVGEFGKKSLTPSVLLHALAPFSGVRVYEYSSAMSLVSP